MRHQAKVGATASRWDSNGRVPNPPGISSSSSSGPKATAEITTTKKIDSPLRRNPFKNGALSSPCACDPPAHLCTSHPSGEHGSQAKMRQYRRNCRQDQVVRFISISKEIKLEAHLHVKVAVSRQVAVDDLTRKALSDDWGFAADDAAAGSVQEREIPPSSLSFFKMNMRVSVARAAALVRKWRAV